jgi:hypothetical protein
LATSNYFFAKYDDFGIFFPKEFFVPFALDFVCCHNAKFAQKKKHFSLVPMGWTSKGRQSNITII